MSVSHSVVDRQLPAPSASAAALEVPPALAPRSTPAQSEPLESPLFQVPAVSAKSNLLLASLQRVYGESVPHEPIADAASDRFIAKPARQSTYQSTMDLLDTVFDVGELDPLPFADRHGNQAGGEKVANRRDPATVGAAEANDKAGTAGQAACGTGGLSSLPALASQATRDRRGLPRRESDCTVLLCAYPGGERLSPAKITWHLHAAKMKGQLVDVSMSGVALSLSDQLAPGTKLVLRITNRALGKHVETAAAVLRCRQENDAEWNVVCRFEKNLTFEQIHLIGRNLFASTIV